MLLELTLAPLTGLSFPVFKRKGCGGRCGAVQVQALGRVRSRSDPHGCSTTGLPVHHQLRLLWGRVFEKGRTGVCPSRPPAQRAAWRRGRDRHDLIAVAAAVTIRACGPAPSHPCFPPHPPSSQAPGRASPPLPGSQTPAETLRLQGAPLRRSLRTTKVSARPGEGHPGPDLETGGEGWVVPENGRGLLLLTRDRWWRRGRGRRSANRVHPGWGWGRGMERLVAATALKMVLSSCPVALSQRSCPFLSFTLDKTMVLYADTMESGV